MKVQDCHLLLLYWIPKLHKQRYIAGAGKCSIKPLPFLASIFTDVKTGLQKYHDICFSRSGVN
jgi:hypothetical protein